MSVYAYLRALEKDILIAKEVTKINKNAKIQIVVPVSDLQIKYSVNANKEQISNAIKKHAINLAKKYFKQHTVYCSRCYKSRYKLFKKITCSCSRIWGIIIMSSRYYWLFYSNRIFYINKNKKTI